MTYLEQAQRAWANARQSEEKLQRGTLTQGQQEVAASFVPRAKQDAATLAQLAQAEALVRIADNLDTLLAALQAGRMAQGAAFPANPIHFMARKPKSDDDDS